MAYRIRTAQEVAVNSSPSTVMHIDLNSCFASIEQQANPLLRNRPVAVAAYETPHSAIIAPSIEAKREGVRVGMRVSEGKKACPDLQVLAPDPWKYRYVNRKTLEILGAYTPAIDVKSIDEMNLDFAHVPERDLHTVAREIKAAMKQQIGDWMKVSIGISTNGFLAKQAANLKKPDGLHEINADNLLEVLARLELQDLFGIAERNKARLLQAGISTPLDLFHAKPQTLIAAFANITGYYWHLRIRGWEIDDVDFPRKSLSNAYALLNQTPSEEEVSQLLCKLTEKLGTRLRRLGYSGAKGVHFAVQFADATIWHRRARLAKPVFASQDLYRRVLQMYLLTPRGKRIHSLFVTVYDLVKGGHQLSFFEDDRKQELTTVMDAINARYGDFTIIPAVMMGMEHLILDRVPFGGGVGELEALMQKERGGQ